MLGVLTGKAEFTYSAMILGNSHKYRHLMFFLASLPHTPTKTKEKKPHFQHVLVKAFLFVLELTSSLHRVTQ